MRVLLIEDDRALSEILCAKLEEAGYETECAHDGEEALVLARAGAHDILLLDRMLPGLDGLTLLRRLRAGGLTVPVLFLTALDGIGDRVDGLDAGADDYLTKPFAVEELLARMRALIRRPRELESDPLLRYGDVTLDPEQKLLEANGQCVSLSKRECALLEAFLRSPGQILPRERLLTRVWGASAEIEEGNLDTYIHFVRRRLKAVKSRTRLTTVHAVGYRLVDEAETEGPA